MKTTSRLVLIILAAACGEGDSVFGGIEVTGWLDPSRIDATSAEPLTTTTPVPLGIAGRPGAAPGRGRITAANQRTAEEVTVSLTSAGSFVAQLQALENDRVTVRFIDGEDVDAVDLVASIPATFPDVAAPPNVQAPDVHGNAVVTVTFAGDLVDTQIFVANHNNSEVAELTQLSPTSVAGHVAAHSGDTLLLYAVTSAGTSNAHGLPVP
jgi:hypothetical protein